MRVNDTSFPTFKMLSERTKFVSTIWQTPRKNGEKLEGNGMLQRCCYIIEMNFIHFKFINIIMLI